jgi:undecaprenyl-phosphate 4-deoxy-4-formamido-L-arabinose transferase
VTIDDDLQNPPEEIPTLLGLIPEHADVVYGTPQRGQHGFLRNSASWITKQALKRSMNTPVASKISAFRAFSTDLRQSFASYWGASVSLDVLLSWGTMRFASVVVRHDARAAGQSGYSLWKLVTHALNMVTGFSTIPLRAATLLGFVFAAGGGASLLFVLIRFIIDGGVVPGFAFLACALSVFSGVQLIVLGVVGEYLGRVFMYVSGSPCYSIADVAGRGRSPS